MCSLGRTQYHKEIIWGPQKKLIFPVGTGHHVECKVHRFNEKERKTTTSSDSSCLPGIPRSFRGLRLYVLLDREDSSLVKQLENELSVVWENTTNKLNNMGPEGLADMRKAWLELKTAVMKHPRLFDNIFKAGTLKIPPLELVFKNLTDKLETQCTRLKPFSHMDFQIVTRRLQQALDKGIVEPSDSGWRSSVLPVPKPPRVVNGKKE